MLCGWHIFLCSSQPIEPHTHIFQRLSRIFSCVKPFKFYLMCMRKHYKHTIIYMVHTKMIQKKKRNVSITIYFNEKQKKSRIYIVNGNFWCGFLLLCRFSSLNLLLLLLFRIFFIHKQRTHNNFPVLFIICFLCILNIKRFYIS